jgi:ribosome maturation factor RimP
MKTELLAIVSEYLNDVLSKSNGMEIYDITYRREPAGNVLRVEIDGDNVTLNSLEYITKELLKRLNVDSRINSRNYRLEVSTPGINRRLRNLEDFRKYLGDNCIVLLNKDNVLNRKCVKGKILSVVDDLVNIEEKDNRANIIIKYTDIKNARLDRDIVFQ